MGEITEDYIRKLVCTFYNKKNISHIEKINVVSLNKVFMVSEDKHQYILKFYNFDNVQNIIWTKRIQDHLHKNFNIAPEILRNTNGQLITTTKKYIFSLEVFLAGYHPSSIKNDIKLVAKKLALVHSKLKRYSAKKTTQSSIVSNQKIIEDIEYSQRKINEINLTKNYHYIPLFNNLLDIRREVSMNTPINYCPKYQLIHGDVRPQNIIINQKQVYFIDFDFSSYSDFFSEIIKSAILCSDYDINLIKLFINQYSFMANTQLPSLHHLFQNLLFYLIQSNFPIYIIDGLTDEVIIPILNERIKLINFCKSIVISKS
ncbi:phosphotransferase [Bacillus cereus]|uniref:phosphotransferase n=1 Tax=Bacillus sp. BB56-3 TaxID=2217831 RepID=UPI0011EBDB99|nr:phosphotransferase [Bacillus sp. BB56-3]KAA0800282.1 hypothetical protein DN406_03900 [Bacillus sp. BB56-3]MCU4757459.1 phosphotransferase [Bacillus cereus]